MRAIALFLAASALLAGGCAEVPKAAAPAAAAAPELGPSSDGLALNTCRLDALCYDDADGVTQFWVDIYSKKIFSAEVRARQERYNLWFRGLETRNWPMRVTVVEAPLGYQYYQPPRRTLAGDAITIPKSIRASGRLDQDTLAIPLYRAVFRLLVAERRFETDCERDYAVDYESNSLCGRIAFNAMRKGYERAPTPAEMQRFPADFRRRAAALERAFALSHRLAAALEELLRSSGRYPEVLILEGVNPDQLAPDKIRAMELADVLLAAAIDEVEWAADAYRPVKSARSR